jgi:hypothetical protein
LALSACQYPLVLVITNGTDTAVAVSLRLAAPDSSVCIEPHSLSYVPASHVGRRLREPDRLPAREVSFDPQLCAMRGTIPPGTALELEFPSVAYFHFFGDDPTAELRVEGEAGSITLQGAQLGRHLEKRRGVFVLEYGRG